MALKETKHMKSDLFRPWDAAAAAAAESSKKNDMVITTSNDTSTEKKRLRNKSLEPKKETGTDESSDNRSQTTSESSSSHHVLISPMVPFPQHFNPVLPNGSHFTDAIRSFDPNAVPQPFNFNMFSETTFLNGFFPSSSSAFLDAQSSSGNRSWKSQQRKLRPKRFQCPHCQVSFSNNGQLRGHVRIHTGM